MPDSVDLAPATYVLFMYKLILRRERITTFDLELNVTAGTQVSIETGTNDQWTCSMSISYSSHPMQKGYTFWSFDNSDPCKISVFATQEIYSILVTLNSSMEVHTRRISIRSHDGVYYIQAIVNRKLIINSLRQCLLWFVFVTPDLTVEMKIFS